MAEQRGSAQRRAALTGHVLTQLDTGALVPGDPLPSLRSLSAAFGLSAPTILNELGALIASGRLVSVPRVGIFVGRTRTETSPTFLFVRPKSRTALEQQHGAAICAGFEERIAELGGSTIPLTCAELEQMSDRATLMVHCAGTAIWRAEADEITHLLPGLAGLPQVHIGRPASEEVDTVRFDDIGGGRLAVEHLLGHGHTSIAYLGLHVAPPHGPDPGHQYSADREVGWRRAMDQANLVTTGLEFTLARPVVDHRTAREAARLAAQDMVGHRHRFTAVVGADDHAVLGLVDAWVEHGVPHAEWPALVGFEGTLGAEHLVSTSILPQWHELGVHAAQLLWDRHHRTLTGAGVERMAGMKLLARMTSAQAWPTQVPIIVEDLWQTRSGAPLSR